MKKKKQFVWNLWCILISFEMGRTPQKGGMDNTAASLASWKAARMPAPPGLSWNLSPIRAWSCKKGFFEGPKGLPRVARASPCGGKPAKNRAIWKHSQKFSHRNPYTGLWSGTPQPQTPQRLFEVKKRGLVANIANQRGPCPLCAASSLCKKKNEMRRRLVFLWAQEAVTEFKTSTKEGSCQQTNRILYFQLEKVIFNIFQKNKTQHGDFKMFILEDAAEFLLFQTKNTAQCLQICELSIQKICAFSKITFFQCIVPHG